MSSTAMTGQKAGNALPGPKGREAETPAQIPAAGWKEIALRTWNESSKDNISLVAAGVAFYGFLAMVPLLGATVLTYGLIASPQTVLQNVGSLAKTMPQDIAKVIGEQLMNVVRTSGSKKGLGLIAALAVALWGARNAAGSVITALNIAYEEEEDRSWVKLTLLSIGVTVAAVLLAMIGAAAIGAMAGLGKALPSMGQAGIIGGQVLAYAVLAAVAAAAAATLYRYGPSRRKAKWTWLTPGSIFFSLAWVVLTLGFGFYVSRFGKYDVTYGSLGGVVILVTWFYLSSFVLLFGAEFNSEVEQQTARDTTKGSTEKPLGTRGAWSADHVAAGSVDKGREVSGEQPLSDETASRGEEEQVSRGTLANASFASDHPFVVARLANRAGPIAGLRKVGLASTLLSTFGLSLLRRRGRELLGGTLVAAAVGLSLLKRDD